MELTGRLLEKFTLTMLERGLSEATQKIYLKDLCSCLQWLKLKDPTLITVQNIKEYQAHLVRRKLRPKTVNRALVSVKLFFRMTLENNVPVDFIYRIKDRRRLPTLLDQEEIITLFKNTKNIKYRTIFMLIYAAGLRSCEVRRLKYQDIDSKLMQIHITGKGERERVVPMSKFLLQVLREYWVKSAENKTKWLFPVSSDEWQKPLSRISIWRAFKKAKKRASIIKPGGVHVLRHCYATHLLEGGLDLRMIQILLGHASIRATEIYTHLQRDFAQGIQSPLDQIANKIK